MCTANIYCQLLHPHKNIINSKSFIHSPQFFIYILPKLEGALSIEVKYQFPKNLYSTHTKGFAVDHEIYA